MALGPVLAYMLVTNAAYMQNKLIYPDNTQCQEVSMSLQQSGYQAQCQTTYVPSSMIPSREGSGAYMLVTNLSSAGIGQFYPDNTSCQSVARSLRQGSIKASCRFVRVSKDYVMR